MVRYKTAEILQPCSYGSLFEILVDYNGGFFYDGLDVAFTENVTER
jgi:hypothetical protein